ALGTKRSGILPEAARTETSSTVLPCTTVPISSAAFGSPTHSRRPILTRTNNRALTPRISRIPYAKKFLRDHKPSSSKYAPDVTCETCGQISLQTAERTGCLPHCVYDHDCL